MDEPAHDQLAGARRPRAAVSVVIPCFNALKDLPLQLDALAASRAARPFEVVLADNGANEGLAELVRERAFQFPAGLRHVPASYARGVAHARNAGCAAAAADRILICDADDVVGPHWVAAMDAALDHADLVGGSLSSERVNAEAARVWRSLPEPGTLPVKLGHLPYAVGANTGLHRRVFEALGGWDETFVGGGDDVEFCWRAQHAGFSLAAAPDAIIYYKLRDSLAAAVKQSYTYAKSDAQLLLVFREAGVSPTGWQAPFRQVGSLLKSAALLRDASRRGQWLRHAAMFAGRVVGSARHRVWAL